MYNLKVWQFPHGRTSGVDHRHVHKYDYPSPKLPPLLLLRGTGLFLRLLLQVPSTVTCGTGLFPSILQIPTTCMWYIRHYYFSLLLRIRPTTFLCGRAGFFSEFPFPIPTTFIWYGVISESPSPNPHTYTGIPVWYGIFSGPLFS